MKKRWMKTTGAIVAVCTLLAGCTGSTGTNMENPTTVSGETKEVSEAKETEEQKVQLEDGIYTAEFDTDSSMFHVSEACDGKGKLTVKDGKMTMHISLASQKILNLYYGLAEDARKEGAELLQPTEDTVIFSDGTSEVVNGFDIPVPAIDEQKEHGMTIRSGFPIRRRKKPGLWKTAFIPWILHLKAEAEGQP